MTQIGSIKLCVSNKEEDVPVYEQGTPCEKIDRGDAEAPVNHCIILLSGNLAQSAEAMVYTFGREAAMKALGRINLKKQDDGTLDYAC